MRKWFDMEFRFPLEQVAEHGYKVGSGQTLLRIDQTAEVHIGVAEAEAIGGTAKREEPTVRFNGADEALEEFADVLLNGELVGGREVLYDEIEETE